MFAINTADNKARTGTLTTAHGTVQTPFLMPVATKGTVKYMTPELLKKIRNEAIIANGLILSQNPGDEFIKKLGGIHKFMHYQNTIFTDSGGFQMIREQFYIKTTDDGVVFNNPVSGKKRFLLTPEDTIRIQQNLGSDVMMVLDDHNKYGLTKEHHEKAVQRTYDWGLRCYKARTNKHQLLFGIVQGGTFEDLRKKSAELTREIPFDGYAIGGLGIGETDEELNAMIDLCTAILPTNKPRYVMGIGKPLQILNAVEHGIDCFDSIYPTQAARHNSIFTKAGIIDIAKGRWKEDTTPLDKGCTCYTCKHFTKAFINHLVKTDEKIALQYKTIHNLQFMHTFMNNIRKAIKQGKFQKFKKTFTKRWTKTGTKNATKSAKNYSIV